MKQIIPEIKTREANHPNRTSEVILVFGNNGIKIKKGKMIINRKLEVITIQNKEKLGLVILAFLIWFFVLLATVLGTILIFELSNKFSFI